MTTPTLTRKRLRELRRGVLIFRCVEGRGEVVKGGGICDAEFDEGLAIIDALERSQDALLAYRDCFNCEGVGLVRYDAGHGNVTEQSCDKCNGTGIDPAISGALLPEGE